MRPDAPVCRKISCELLCLSGAHHNFYNSPSDDSFKPQDHIVARPGLPSDTMAHMPSSSQSTAELPPTGRTGALDPDLIVRLHNLPQELLDQVRDFALLPHQSLTNQVITIDKHWHAPSALAIDSTSRQLCANIYYCTNTFDFSGFSTKDGLDLCLEWIFLLSSDHRRKTSRVIFQDPVFQSQTPLDCTGLLHYIISNPTAAHEKCIFTDRNHGMNSMGLIVRLQRRADRVSSMMSEWDCDKVTAGSWGLQHPMRREFWQWAMTTLNLRVQWLGADGKVHDLWLPSRAHEAAKELIRTVRKHVLEAN